MATANFHQTTGTSSSAVASAAASAYVQGTQRCLRCNGTGRQSELKVRRDLKMDMQKSKKKHCCLSTCCVPSEVTMDTVRDARDCEMCNGAGNMPSDAILCKNCEGSGFEEYTAWVYLTYGNKLCPFPLCCFPCFCCCCKPMEYAVTKHNCRVCEARGWRHSSQKLRSNTAMESSNPLFKPPSSTVAVPAVAQVDFGHGSPVPQVAMGAMPPTPQSGTFCPSCGTGGQSGNFCTNCGGKVNG